MQNRRNESRLENDQGTKTQAGRENAGRIQEIDWSRSVLGPIDNWPPSLRTAVCLALAARQPMFVWWGPKLLNFHNEACKSMVRENAPQAFRQPASAVWSEIWDRVGPAAESVMQGNAGIAFEIGPINRERNNPAQETYYSISLSPIPDDRGMIGGVVGTCTDETKRIIDQQQMTLLRGLTASMAQADTAAETCARAAGTLQTDPSDLPFALIYLLDGGTQQMLLGGAAGVRRGTFGAPEAVPLADNSLWPFAKVLETGKSLLISDLGERLKSLPVRVWRQPVRQALLVPVAAGQQMGVLVAGLSPARRFDDEYRGFIDLVAAQISASLGRLPASNAATRQEAEAALRETEQRYRQLVHALPAAVYTTDAEGRIALFNQAAVELWGRTPEIGRDCWSGAFRMFRIDGTPLRSSELPMATAVKTRKPFVGEDFIVEREDGSRAYVRPHPQPMFDSAGKLLGAVNMLLDVTEQYQAEIASRKNEQWLQQATRTGKVGVWDWDIAANHITWTQALYAIYGVKPSEFNATVEGVMELIHPEDRAAVSDGIGIILERGEPYETEFRVLRPNGEIVWLFTNAVAVRDGNRVVRLRGVSVDITDRKRAAESLEKQSNRLCLLWETAAILLTNQELDAMLRALFERIAGHFGLDVYLNYLINNEGDALHLDSCEGVPDEVKSTIAQMQIGDSFSDRAIEASAILVANCIQESNDPGLEFVKALGIRAYFSKPLIAGNRLLGTLAFGSRTRDSFEPEEIGFLRTITRYVTVAFERLRLVKELKQADQHKDEFLATLAHELRNPLAPLRNGLQILRLAGLDPAATAEAHGMMERQLDQMVRLIDDLLDVSRISRGKIILHKERVDLAQVIRSAVETSGPKISESGNELFVNAPIDPVFVEGDFTRLAQILANLLNNAAKYTPRGGRIQLSAGSRDGWATISVSDNGIGIPAHMIPKVFDMFTQVDRSLEKAQGGLGIGLTIVKRLVEMHGGAVEARSGGTGMGSEFVVRLPAAPAPTLLNSIDSGSAAGCPASKILVVDDNKDSARSMAMLLAMDGHETQTAFDGIEAIDAAAAFRPDMILMDIGMPKLNGHDACRRIREQAWGKDIVIVALTGWGQDEDRRQSRDVGFDHHLVKPIKVAAVQELLCKCALDMNHA